MKIVCFTSAVQVSIFTIRLSSIGVCRIFLKDDGKKASLFFDFSRDLTWIRSPPFSGKAFLEAGEEKEVELRMSGVFRRSYWARGLYFRGSVGREDRSSNASVLRCQTKETVYVYHPCLCGHKFRSPLCLPPVSLGVSSFLLEGAEAGFRKTKSGGQL